MRTVRTGCSKCIGLLLVVMACTLFPSLAISQTTGTIRGSVKDPSGAVVSSAKVTVIQEGTQIARLTLTTEAGDYEFPVLPVGLYMVRIEARGFKQYEQRNIEVTLGHVILVDAVLQVGEVSEKVTVDSLPPQVETTNTQLGAIVDSHSVTSLPLNQRDPYQFLQLQPGVMSQVGSDLFLGSDQTGVVSVNGGRGRANNYMVNGGDANDQHINLPAIQPSPDTIQEFRVLTNGFDAEFGRNSGSVVNVVTKSGTNDLHGSVYEFFRNKVLDARGFFDQEKRDRKQNQFGGTFGGPIRKNRTFFFTSYEGRRIRVGIPSDEVTVPSADERAGNFSAMGAPFAGTLVTPFFATALSNRPGCAASVGAPLAAGTPYSSLFPGNQIPVTCFDPTALDLLNQFVPLPNQPNGVYQASPISRTRLDQFTARFDHALNEKHQLSVFYYLTDSTTVEPFARQFNAGASLPGFGDTNTGRFQQWNVGETWVLSSSVVNEFRFVYFRGAEGILNQPTRTNLVQNSCVTVPAGQCFSDPSNAKLGITPGLGASIEGVPLIGVTGGFSIGNNFVGSRSQIGNTFQVSDSYSRTVGSHSLKFGGDVRRQLYDQTLYFNVNGYFLYFGQGPNTVDPNNLFPNYLLGLPDLFFEGSPQSEAVRSTSVYLFAQDSWKIRRNLTLNYGLRWELNTPLGDVSGHVNTFRPGQATTVNRCQLSPSDPVAGLLGTTDCSPGSAGQAVFPLGLVVPGDKGISNGLTATDYKSFAPRIGLAWSPNWSDGFLRNLTGGPGKTSIRMGWGMFYNPIEQFYIELSQGEPPFGGSSFLGIPMFNTPFVNQFGQVSPNPFGGFITPKPGDPVDFSVFRPIALNAQVPPVLRAQYAVQYNLTVQRELAKDLLFQIGYVGSQGHRLLGDHAINSGSAQTCLDLISLLGPGTCGPAGADNPYFIPPTTVIPQGFTLHLPYGPMPTITGASGGTSVSSIAPNGILLVGLRPFSSPYCNPVSPTWQGCPPDGVPVFGAMSSVGTIASSSYNSLQALLEKRFAKGLQFQAAYTWSKSFDNSSSLEEAMNTFDFRRSRSLSLFHAAHRLVFNYTWDLPVPQHTGAMEKMVNGWSLSGIVSFQTGFPILITSSSDIELQNDFNQFMYPGKPDLVKPFQTMDPRNSQHLFFDPSIFAQPALGTIGNSPRTICCGPSISNWDMAILKNTGFGHEKSIQFRAEFFNILNHAQFFNPDGNITDPTFGTIKRVRDPRLVQLALKLSF